MSDYIIAEKLDTFTQLHLARKLSPAMPIVSVIQNPDNATKSKSMLVVMMLSYISDEDSDYVVKKCLSVVRRIQDNQPQRVITTGGVLAYADMNMEDITEMVAKVVLDNLGDFLNTALAISDQ